MVVNRKKDCAKLKHLEVPRPSKCRALALRHFYHLFVFNHFYTITTLSPWIVAN
jgi:hypothetical protein